MTDKEEKYFVGSNDSPDCMYFGQEEAFKGGNTYIDSFNTVGEKVNSYKLDRVSFGINIYTTSF